MTEISLCLRPWGILSAILLAGVGCSEADPLAHPTAHRLRGLSRAYLDYAVAKGCGPLDLQELTNHVKSMRPFSLGIGGDGVSTAGDLFLSSRDGQPFVIRFGRALSLSKHAEAIAHEASAIEGVRYVAFADGRVECVKEGVPTGQLLGSMKGL